jgi:hypothetical protein
MEGLIEELTRGNVTEVKVVLATVIVALAVYQLALAAVSYGKVRPRFLESGPATWARSPASPSTVGRRAAPTPSSAAWRWERWR